jgi:hypothetical protein
VLFGKPGESIIVPDSTLSTTAGLPKFVRGLQGYSYDRLGGTLGRFQDLSPDGKMMLFQSVEEAQLVTRDPTQSMHVKTGSERVLCGDDYTGVIYDRKCIYPWALTHSDVSLGAVPAVAHDEWLSVLSSGHGNYLAQDGSQLVRLSVSADGSRIKREMEFLLPGEWHSFREFSSTGVAIIERAGDFVVTPNFAVSTSFSRATNPWRLPKPVGDGVALEDVALSQDCFTAYGLRAYSPVPELGTIQLFTWECGGRISSNIVDFPARSGLSAAISPGADKIAAIGELFDGQNSLCILHVWSIPELRPIASEIFESRWTKDTTVSFDALGKFVVVSSGSNRLVWHFDERDKLTGVGTYSGGSSLLIDALAAGAPTLVVQEKSNEGEPSCHRFRWIDFNASSS